MTKNKLIKIAIVGRPNVGKSSLFNAIVGDRRAIVEPRSGTTRDRLYADIRWKDREFTLIDTGGFEAKLHDDMTELILKQLHAGIEEADMILFVTDGSVGITPQDTELASRLRKTSKKIYLVVNKIDDKSVSGRALEFFSLGLADPYSVSATHNTGIDNLLDRAVAEIGQSAETPNEKAVKVAIVGRPNVGKSSYLNALLKEERAIVHHIAGTTRDATDTDFNYKGKDYILIDTAGIRHDLKIKESADFYGSVRSKEAIKRADVAMIIIDGYDGLREDDGRVIDFVIKSGKALVVAVNKWDLNEGVSDKKCKEMLIKKMNAIRNYPVIFMSCKTKKNVTTSLDAIWSAYERSNAIIAPEKLSDILESLNELGEVRYNNIKFKSIRQESALPPEFTVVSKDVNLIKDNMKRQIENFLRSELDLEGVPIRVKFTK
ncbi:MAG: ribosome biogenesis GTPase Der [Candidatus Omnitrophica bacterium]|nr:ribosome biogenesis GTPase Der [Candidatus Omnitrophota bacterium]